MTGPRRPPRLVVGLVLAAVFLLLGFVLPLLAGQDPRDWNAFPKNLRPSRANWLGTTGLGQDTFWLLTYSLRNSLILGVLVGFFATVIGVVVGVLTAAGRWPSSTQDQSRPGTCGLSSPPAGVPTARARAASLA